MEADRPLLMIPGPIELSPAVLKATGEPSLSHVSPDFINLFSEALVLLRQVQQLACQKLQSWISINHFLCASILIIININHIVVRLQVFLTTKAQPFVVSGSGTLGWDMVRRPPPPHPTS